jgi:hypothetical protein
VTDLFLQNHPAIAYRPVSRRLARRHPSPVPRGGGDARRSVVRPRLPKTTAHSPVPRGGGDARRSVVRPRLPKTTTHWILHARTRPRHPLRASLAKYPGEKKLAASLGPCHGEPHRRSTGRARRLRLGAEDAIPGVVESSPDGGQSLSSEPPEQSTVAGLLPVIRRIRAPWTKPPSQELWDAETKQHPVLVVHPAREPCQPCESEPPQSELSCRCLLPPL